MLRYSLAVVATLCAGAAQADFLYDFVEANTGATLARWRLANLPAMQEDVVSFQFTPAGQALFGLGETYPEPFTHAVDSYPRDDGADGLRPLLEEPLFILPSLADLEAAPSSLVDTPVQARFYAGYRVAAGLDELRYTWNDSANGPGEISALGDWVRTAVPEPAGAGLAGIALACASAWRRVRVTSG